MSVLAPLREMGIEVSLSDDGKGVRLQGKVSQMDPAQIEQIAEYARKRKTEILIALSQRGEPGACESCPAAGYWDYALYAGQGLLCFHYAVYLGKSGRPKPCAEIRARCPRGES